MTLKNGISAGILMPLLFLIGEKLEKINPPKCPIIGGWLSKTGYIRNGMGYIFVMISEKEWVGMERLCGIIFKKQLQTMVKP